MCLHLHLHMQLAPLLQNSRDIVTHRRTSLNSTDWLVFIRDIEFALCEAGTKLVYKI